MLGVRGSRSHAVACRVRGVLSTFTNGRGVGGGWTTPTRDRGCNLQTERMDNPMDEAARLIRLLELMPPTFGGDDGGFHSAYERLTGDQKRAVVFLRDSFRCALSGTETDLLLHHLYPNRDESRGMASVIVLNRWWHTDHHERLRAGDPDEADIAAELRAIADARSREVERWLTAVWGGQ